MTSIICAMRGDEKGDGDDVQEGPGDHNKPDEEAAAAADDLWLEDESAATGRPAATAAAALGAPSGAADHVLTRRRRGVGARARGPRERTIVAMANDKMRSIAHSPNTQRGCAPPRVTMMV